MTSAKLPQPSLSPQQFQLFLSQSKITMVLDLASGAGTAKNIDNSPAYQFLDELQSSGTLTPAQVEMYKAKYAQLHDYVLKTYALEKAMVDQSRKLNTIVYEEGKKIEKLKTSRYKLQEQIKPGSMPGAQVQLLRIHHRRRSWRQPPPLPSFRYALREGQRNDSPASPPPERALASMCLNLPVRSPLAQPSFTGEGRGRKTLSLMFTFFGISKFPFLVLDFHFDFCLTMSS